MTVQITSAPAAVSMEGLIDDLKLDIALLKMEVAEARIKSESLAARIVLGQQDRAALEAALQRERVLSHDRFDSQQDINE